MKLLFDENLSYRLVNAIAQLFPGSIHITQVGLGTRISDRQIWEYARQNGFAIITADTDFVMLAGTSGHPPKVILLENCDYPTSVAEQIIRANSLSISELETNDRAVLILHRS